MRKRLMLLTIIVICLATAVSVSADLDKDVISHYYFNNSNDAVGTYNATTFEAGITSSGCPVGNCAQLNANGSIQYAAAQTNSLSAGTLNLWVKGDTTTVQYNIFAKNSANFRNQYAYSGPVDAVGFQVNGEGLLYSPRGLGISTFSMITHTWNSTMRAIYINGTMVSNSSGSFTTPSSGNLYLGHNSVNTNDRLAGKIDEMTIWNRSLSTSEIIELFGLQSANVTYPFTTTFIVGLDDGYTSNSVSDFNMTVSFANGSTAFYSTSSGSITTTISNDFTDLVNISISSTGYHTVNYLNHNVSSNLEAVSTQIYLNVTARNGLTNDTISSFNISTLYKNYTTSSGSILANLTNSTAHNITIRANGYVTQTTQVQYNMAPSNQTLEFYIYPVLNIRLFNETDGSAFNPNITTSTILRVFCDNATQQQTLLTSTSSFNATCAWDIMRVYVTFGNDTYYRTLKPALNSSTIDFYLINLNTDTAVQKTFLLNDLTGTYGEGSLIFDKIIGTTQVTINEDDWDIENKVIAYFILYDNYIIELTDDDITSRVLGPFIADATSSHTISVPTIPLYADNTIDDFTWGYIQSQEHNWLYMNWQNNNGTLAEINYTIVNASNTSQVFYTNVFNTSTGSVNFTTLYNNSIYKTMLTFTHSSWSTHTDTKMWGGVFLQGDDFSGFSNIAAFKMWFAIIAIIVVALIFNGLTTSAAAIWVVAGTTLFNWIGWLNMPTLWLVVMGVFALMIAFIAEGVNR